MHPLVSHPLQVVAVTSAIPRKALIYDVATGATLMTLTSEAAQPSNHQPEPLLPGLPARAPTGQPAVPGFPLARGIAGRDIGFAFLGKILWKGRVQRLTARVNFYVCAKLAPFLKVHHSCILTHL